MPVEALFVEAGLVAALAGLLVVWWGIGERLGPDATELPRIGTIEAPPLVVYGTPLIVAAWADLVGLAAPSSVIANTITVVGPIAGITAIGAVAWWFVFGRDDGGELG